MQKNSMVNVLVLGSTLLLMTTTASAAEKSCLLEGSFTFGGKTTEIKDCIENNGVPQNQFEEMCSQLVKMTVAFPGGKAGTVTYMPTCPVKPQGICVGFFGQPMSSYYYKRPTNTLADVKSGCLAQGGKWK
jgi:hypothetical protein